MREKRIEQREQNKIK